MWDRQYDVEAEVLETSAETADGGDIEGEDVGVGAAAGAALGAILGGDLGDAVLGGALGAGAGTLVSLGTGDVDPVLPSGTVLTLETEDRINI